MLKAILFDMDGVIIDSEPIWRKVEIDVYSKIGVKLTDTMLKETMGYGLIEAIRYWKDRFKWDYDKYTDNYLNDKIVDKLKFDIKNSGQPMKGVVELLDLLESKDIKIALASGSAYDIINTVTEKLNLENYFEVVCSAQDEPYGKPHPGIFLTAANKLNVKPSECVVIEDSVNGVIAAKAAKMFCIAVPDCDMINDKRFGIADIKLNSLEELNEKLLNEISEKLN